MPDGTMPMMNGGRGGGMHEGGGVGVTRNCDIGEVRTSLTESEGLHDLSVILHKKEIAVVCLMQTGEIGIFYLLLLLLLLVFMLCTSEFQPLSAYYHWLILPFAMEESLC